MNKPITFQVDSEVADAFNQASANQQQAIQSVVSLWLRQMVQPESLEAITHEIRQEAAAKGLTSNILEDLLSDD
jgi:hypothetical protein